MPDFVFTVVAPMIGVALRQVFMEWRASSRRQTILPPLQQASASAKIAQPVWPAISYSPPKALE